jgi:hypothetical protein
VKSGAVAGPAQIEEASGWARCPALSDTVLCLKEFRYTMKTDAQLQVDVQDYLKW